MLSFAMIVEIRKQRKRSNSIRGIGMDRRIEGLLAELKNWGCDIDGALERFLEDRQLYAECLRMAAEDPAYELLEKAFRAGAEQEAFDCAHTLKGVLGNLGLTPLFEAAVRMTELLRERQDGAGIVFYREILPANDKLKEIIGNWEIQSE